jgi:hypothetical protein
MRFEGPLYRVCRNGVELESFRTLVPLHLVQKLTVLIGYALENDGLGGLVELSLDGPSAPEPPQRPQPRDICEGMYPELMERRGLVFAKYGRSFKGQRPYG